MKLTVERAALLRVLAHVGRIPPRGNSIPVLNNLLLTATGGAARGAPRKGRTR